MACWSKWGIGVWSSEGEGDVYGFAPSILDPRRFKPDLECCSPEELEAHAADVAAANLADQAGTTDKPAARTKDAP